VSSSRGCASAICSRVSRSALCGSLRLGRPLRRPALGQGFAVRPQRDGALYRSAAGDARHDAPAETGLLACVGKHGAHIAPRLVDCGGGVYLTSRERPLHDVLERLAEALTERCALCLAVIGEHDQLIRAR
jgi:hypothetical protein